jgi:DNA-binding transcriptional MerR regulator
VEDRAYLSIGEVLGLLKEEFPDVTISKIRFLESQGLLDPERTPSGYRKFYDTDVERLRWILRQQREHFLPLKVIKGRLRGGGSDGLLEADELAVDSAAGATSAPEAGTRPSTPRPTAPALPPMPEPLPVVPQQGVSLTLAEMASASGLDDDDLRELERYGLIAGRKVSTTVYYDEEALGVAQLAAGFMKYGVEARHLRMYKTAGEREAGFFEQVVMPMLKQRNPQARRQAADALSDLTRLGHGLRAAMLRQGLKKYIEGQ